MSSIIFELPNFPQLNQLHEPSNPYPDANASMDCVPTSIAAALTWFHQSTDGQKFYGDELIDENPDYGPKYTGGTAAANYEGQCLAAGVKLSSIDGTPAQLVALLHTLVHEQNPILVTIPGQWNSSDTSGANPGAVTHVCCVYGDGPGMIRMMNPWIAPTPHDVTDDWLTVKLCYGQVWPMGGIGLIPKGPFYQVTAGQNGVPTSGNAVAAAMGLSWQDVLSIPGQNPSLKNYDPTGPYLVGSPSDPTYGVTFLLPGFALAPASVPTTPAPVQSADWQSAVVSIDSTLKALLVKAPAASGGAEMLASLLHAG